MEKAGPWTHNHTITVYEDHYEWVIMLSRLAMKLERHSQEKHLTSARVMVWSNPSYSAF